jgi:pimeloyl-ACP methyl ester carboxylesterase
VATAHQSSCSTAWPPQRITTASSSPTSGRTHVASSGDADALPDTMEDALVHALVTVAHGEPVVLVGNSLGGAAAVRLASRRPDLVAGLYLVAPGGARVDEAELERLVGRFALDSHDDALRFVDDLFHAPHPFRHALAWGTRQQFRRRGVRAIVETFRADTLLDASEVRAAAHLSFWKANLPRHAHLEVGERIGHVPHMDALPLLVRRIAAFLDRVAEPAARPDSRAVPAA